MSRRDYVSRVPPPVPEESAMQYGGSQMYSGSQQQLAQQHPHYNMYHHTHPPNDQQPYVPTSSQVPGSHPHYGNYYNDSHPRDQVDGGRMPVYGHDSREGPPRSAKGHQGPWDNNPIYNHQDPNGWEHQQRGPQPPQQPPFPSKNNVPPTQPHHQSHPSLHDNHHHNNQQQGINSAHNITNGSITSQSIPSNRSYGETVASIGAATLPPPPSHAPNQNNGQHHPNSRNNPSHANNGTLYSSQPSLPSKDNSLGRDSNRKDNHKVLLPLFFTT